MLLGRWVPESYVSCYVADAEQAVAGAQNPNSIVVTHERVSELDSDIWRIEIDSIELEIFSEYKPEMGFAF